MIFQAKEALCASSEARTFQPISKKSKIIFKNIDYQSFKNPIPAQVVLETLDTEEATYVWHQEKNQQGLPENLTAIDEDLATIRNEGRQAFLANQPKNFSRIIHNYSDERKGFILWRELPFILIDFS